LLCRVVDYVPAVLTPLLAAFDYTSRMKWC